MPKDNQLTVALICCSISSTDALRFARSVSPLAHPFELVVVLQGDQSARDVAELKRLPCTKVISLTKRGLAGARNVGIQATTAEWCAFPDDDCWYESNTLQAMEQAIAASTGESILIARWLETRGTARRILPDSNWGIARSAFSIELIAQRGALVAIGGFDSRLGVGARFEAGEEVDVVLRLLGAGCSARFVDDVCVRHPAGRQEYERAGRFAAFDRARRRGRGYGALQAKHGLSLSRIFASATVSSFRRFVSGGQGAPAWLGEWWGRLSGGLTWRIKVRERV
jgi:glycosyltransferase involved in cell wall biosynthesis